MYNIVSKRRQMTVYKGRVINTSFLKRILKANFDNNKL